jgi:poly(hydroxyalkanoate) depolymerase family esterase
MLDVPAGRTRRGRRRLLATGVVLALLTGLIVFLNVRKPSLEEVTGFGSNPGALKMYEFVPTGLGKHRPLVVLIHGCLAKASDIDNESGWTRWAEEYEFALLLPQQDPANNRRRCFNGFRPGDQERDKGEPLSIRQMTEWMLTKHDLDRDRVFVNGLSAGGVMTTVMLGAYPDVYKAGASIAAGPFQCATGGPEAQGCNTGRRILTPKQWGDKVRGASGWKGAWPRVSVWHGTEDRTVNVQQLTETMKQWTDVHGLDQVPEVTEQVGGYPHLVYEDRAGRPVVETWTITGMDHGFPVTGHLECGVVGPYFPEVDVCASQRIAQWFGLSGR